MIYGPSTKKNLFIPIKVEYKTACIRDLLAGQASRHGCRNSRFYRNHTLNMSDTSTCQKITPLSIDEPVKKNRIGCYPLLNEKALKPAVQKKMPIQINL